MTTVETTPTGEEQEQPSGPLDLRTLFNAGVHFGHPSKRWNPKMERFIFTKRAGSHIIDLPQTLTAIERAKAFAFNVASNGGQILFVGTKKQARAAIEEESRRAGAMYINQRWLGGMLTNFQTIQARIERLVRLEEAAAKGELEAQTKREALRLQTEITRLNKFFGGIKEMTKLPDVLYVVDISEEHIAIKEAARLNIPVVAIVDTNCDPDTVTYPIPANDDSMRSIRLITAQIADAVIEGRALARKRNEDRMAAEAELEAQEEAARAQAQAEAAARLAAQEPAAAPAAAESVAEAESTAETTSAPRRRSRSRSSAETKPEEAAESPKAEADAKVEPDSPVAEAEAPASDTDDTSETASESTPDADESSADDEEKKAE